VRPWGQGERSQRIRNTALTSLGCEVGLQLFSIVVRLAAPLICGDPDEILPMERSVMGMLRPNSSVRSGSGQGVSRPYEKATENH
jgi:hypothetical protein